jgi:hypothetical protein
MHCYNRYKLWVRHVSGDIFQLGFCEARSEPEAEKICWQRWRIAAEWFDKSTSGVGWYGVDFISEA